ncbi:cysteine hydrolase [Acuticoccus sp. MNP-M23]|uniref:cysteine hydrolase family protein n=1 Tax=Acuticoccus sp. MNP-M23 TaxID=3072793 RepID=UPI00281570C8|nr:cysteine hydrolase [Acuticoccus sp. MNP-M23]WMS42582.1 cysteine hydrolase [Acuticoccus sp. MNP-M23]
MRDTALLIVDLQNDFVHPDGAYGRAGQASPEIAALPGRVKPLADLVRQKGGVVVSTQFTLVPGRGGEPMIAPHLKKLRPFLASGDFAPGSWGNQLVDELGPADFAVEKIAYNAFYMTRLDWVLRKNDITRLLVCGIVTNGGVATTFREAHVREFDAILLEDGCGAFSVETHRTAVDALRPVGRVASIAEISAEIEAG